MERNEKKWKEMERYGTSTDDRDVEAWEVRALALHARKLYS